MNTWIALLRGVNVGGRNRLPMAELRALLEGRGYRDVRTLLQSGNCVLAADGGDAAAVADDIGAAIESAFGFRPQVFVLAPAELEAALAANPFPQGHDAPGSVHFFFLAAPAPGADLAALEALAADGEAVRLTDAVLYLYAPAGIGRSKLAARIGTHVPVAMTARNLATVLRLAEAAGVANPVAGRQAPR